MIGVGIIGAGHFGALHAKALAEVQEAELVAACRNDPDAIAAFTRVHGGRPYADWRALLDDAAVEAVAIATPHHLHAEIAIAALRAGKHVLLEKPMAVTPADCEAILAAGAGAPGRLMVGHLPHFAPMLVAAEWIAGGELGRPVAGTSIFSKLWMEPNRQGWHLDPATGGGMLATAGIHALDRLIFLMGSEVVSVGAMMATRFHAQAADDLALLNLRFAGGQLGQVASVGYRDGAVTSGLELVCEGGTLSLDLTGRLRVGKGGTWRDVAVRSEADPMLEALRRQWRAFIAAIAAGGPAPISGRYGAHLVGILDAAVRADAERREVALTA